MLIDASHREETRVVVVKGNRLEDFDFESEHKKQIRGNIYLAKVTRVEPSLQAAFVDYGGNRHGFLAFSEIHPDYYQIPLADRQALLAEEARLAEQEDEDNDDDGDSRSASSSSRRKRGGRRNRSSRRDKPRVVAVPDAEPVAMDAILAAWEEAQAAEADKAEAEASVDDAADDGDSTPDTMAARTVDDGNVISEDPETDEDDDDTLFFSAFFFVPRGLRGLRIAPPFTNFWRASRNFCSSTSSGKAMEISDRLGTLARMAYCCWEIICSNTSSVCFIFSA